MLTGPVATGVVEALATGVLEEGDDTLRHSTTPASTTPIATAAANIDVGVMRWARFSKALFTGRDELALREVSMRGVGLLITGSPGIAAAVVVAGVGSRNISRALVGMVLPYGGVKPVGVPSKPTSRA
ncbi:unannotated protein [freshwater metagenome]|uniref:Unannotated protein n=1 Tax=freshwater metagenome TaxID=449393 RepID=A0A6J7UPN3_9ZZZZ